MKYLVVWTSADTCVYGPQYEISKSRNAIVHMKIKNANRVWVYDRNGWWLSYADRDSNGNPYRPQMFPDGEPHRYYAQRFRELASATAPWFTTPKENAT